MFGVPYNRKQPVAEYKNPRELKAEAMMRAGLTPREIWENAYTVPSQTRKKTIYTVTREGPLIWECTCPDKKYRPWHVCKHIFLVKTWLGMKDAMLQQDAIQLTDQLACKYCHGVNVVKNGSRKTRYNVKTRYLCHGCGRGFVIEEEGFSNMKFDPRTVTMCLDLYYKGTSFRKITDHLKVFHGLDIHWTTIGKWIRKYMAIVNEYVKTLEPDLGHIWNADEMMIKVNGDYSWLWNIIDNETRFLLTNLITRKRGIKEARTLFRAARQQAKVRPNFVTVDGLMSYRRAFRKEFIATMGRRPMLLARAGPNKEVHNNKIERLHGTIREREKVMRGMKSDETAEILLNGFKNYYNFVRPHQALNGETPAERAGIDLSLGKNKWLGLIKKGMEHQKNGAH